MTTGRGVVNPNVVAAGLLFAVPAASADKPAACPALAEPSTRTLIQATCQDVRSALSRVPGARLRTSRTSFVDERFACVRQGCVVTLDGSFRALQKEPSPDSWLDGFLERKGWIRTDSHDADGPDGTVFAFHKPGALCIVEGRWNHWDDEQGSHTDDEYQVSVSCGGAGATPPLP